jgi:FAD/FMN-containing dehydrogenase
MPTLNNWNHEIRFDVADDQLKTPTQVSEVQDIVKEASSRNQRVTVIGAMHSTTECIVGSGIVISMKHMARILAIDQQQMTVTVQAGATLHEVCSHLKELGLQLPVILEFGNFQIGAISGTHANDTSMTHSAQFSSHVAGIKLVTPAGDIMEISETQNAEYLPAVRSHFGMLGVVCEVTVRLFKTQPLHVGFQIVKVDSLLDGFTMELEALKGANDQVFGMLFPASGKLLWQCRKFVEPVKPNPHSLATWLDPVESKGINLFGDLFLPLVKAITAAHPSAAVAGLVNTALVDLPLKIIQHSSYTIDPCDRGILYSKDDPGFDFYDWMFPEGNWVAMVRALLELSERFRQEREFILPLPVLIYFLKQDQASLLSRSRSGNMIAVDPAYPDPSDPTWKAFRLAFNEIAMKHGGIPHINKTRDGAIGYFAKAHDQESLKHYLEIRKKFDPKNLFLNDFFKTMFAEYL